MALLGQFKHKGLLLFVALWVSLPSKALALPVVAEDNVLGAAAETVAEPPQEELSASSLLADSEPVNIKLTELLNRHHLSGADLNGVHDRYNLNLAQAVINNVDIDVPIAGGMRLQWLRSFVTGDYDDHPLRDTRRGKEESDPFWQFHPGYIQVLRTDAREKKWNPHYVAADSSVMELVGDNHDNNRFVTKERWQVSRLGNGFTLRSPEGITYEFTHEATLQDSRYGAARFRYYLKKQYDAYGNGITYDYDWVFPTQITSTDGKVIAIEYEQTLRVGHKNYAKMPAKVFLNGQEVVRYRYTAIKEGSHSAPKILLARAQFSDGRAFEYRYNLINVRKNHCGDHRIILSAILQPDNSQIQYTYRDDDRMRVSPCRSPFELASKTLVTATGEVFRWDISDSRRVETVEGHKQMIRRVTGPDYATEYSFGYQENHRVWQMGLLRKKVVYNDKAATERVQTETFDYAPVKISDLKDKTPDWYINKSEDEATYTADLSRYTIERDGNFYQTEYNDRDEWGNPHQLLTTHQGKTQSLVIEYDIKPEHNLIHNVKSIQVNGKAYRSYRYNKQGRVSSDTVFGVTRHYTYNDQGELFTETDALNHTTTYEDYKSGFAQKTTHAKNTVTLREVDALGRVVSATNGRGFTTRYAYDLFGRLTTLTPPLGQATFTHYKPDLTTEVTHGKTLTTTKTDLAGHPWQVDTTDTTTGATIRLTKHFDAYGREDFTSYPYLAGKEGSQGVYTAYDALNRPTTRCAPNKNSFCTRYQYLPHDQVLITRANGAQTTETYWSLNGPDEQRIERIAQPEGVTTSLVRDDFGRVQAITQGALTRYYFFDLHGYLDHEIHPEIGTLQYERDTLGNMTAKIYPLSGTRIEYSYDALNQLERVESHDTSKRFVYNNTGHVTDSINETAHWHYEYDANDTLILEEARVADLAPLQWHYHINDSGQLDAVEYPSGKIIDYKPNAFNQPTQVGHYLTEVRYTPTGQLAAATYPSGQSLTLHYNARALPETLASPFVSYRYAYDEVGNTHTVTDLLNDSHSLRLGYDKLDRLTVANGPWGDGVLTYDENHNLTSQRLGAREVFYEFHHGLLSRLSGSEVGTPQYDQQGNVTSRGRPTITESMHSNSLNQLTTYQSDAPCIRYAYDGNDQRILTSQAGHKRLTLSNLSGQVVYEYDFTTAQATESYYVQSRRLATASTEGDTLYHWDAQGNTVAASTLDGQLLWSSVYYPFGGEYFSSNKNTLRRGFVDKEYNEETGLNHFGAREYAPTWGRFMSLDPADVDESDPFSFNRYAYGNNNPYKYMDPDGRSAVINDYLGIADVSQVNSHVATTDPNYFLSNYNGVGFDYRPTFSFDRQNLRKGFENVSLDIGYAYGNGKSVTQNVSVSTKGISVTTGLGVGNGFEYSFGVSGNYGSNEGIGVAGQWTYGKSLFGPIASFSSGGNETGINGSSKFGVGGGLFIGATPTYTTQTYSWGQISSAWQSAALSW